LSNAADTKSILLQLGVQPRRSMGQHFLVDHTVIERQVKYAKIKKGERILEIGPGLGFLTDDLLKAGAEVVAIESDRKFCGYLREKFGDRLELIEGDATKVVLPEFDKVVSNLPYQISSEITFRILETRKFDIAILMYQKEFAERMVAGEISALYGRLSVMAAYRADCEILEIVNRRCFWPQPKVDSALVLMKSRPPRFQPKDEKLFVDIVRVLFSHRRKKISNGMIALAGQLGISRDKMKELAPEMPYADDRVEMLSPEEIGEIADWFFETKIESKNR
jgi:16S rRNA (adenine1518-N6/adenine1519-N6)-dimethyltransferase